MDWRARPYGDPCSAAALRSSLVHRSEEESRRRCLPRQHPVPVADQQPCRLGLQFAKKQGINRDYEERTLTAPGFFEDYEDPAGVDDFDWPDPEKYIDPVKCREAVEAVPEDAIAMVLAWSCHFQDACAAFGMETALMKMIAEPEMFGAVIDRITAFYLKANEIFFEATKGRLHARPDRPTISAANRV